MDGYLILKTFLGWKGSLYQYLNVGDLVDEDMVSYYRNVIPPVTDRSHCIQMGEPYSSFDGKNTYSTLKKTEYGWIYAGNCHHGETEEPVPAHG
ncbi:hypothetical protein IRB79_26755 (plasmid) [Cytobacillus oceanisediminis]|nr:hypothetical protein IRB79_26755 [Cytobacillus oceanisediminis]